MALLRVKPSPRLIIIIVFSFIVLHLFYSRSSSSTTDTARTPGWQPSNPHHDHHSPRPPLPVRQGGYGGGRPKLPACKAAAKDLEDIVYVIKTGATEVDERLPVHFDTSLECWPHNLIFADYGELYKGHTIRDALDHITDSIRLENEQFDLWRRLHQSGRAGLDERELSTYHHVADPSDGGGNFGSGGWRLDKFKNIPMVGKTLALKPTAKWFIFTDADTFVSWSNLARWLKKLDHTQVLYLGSPSVIDNQLFGHGGSGYILSRPAMNILANLYSHKQREWDEFALQHWAGDCVLATALDRQNVSLTWSFPILFGNDPLNMDYMEIGYDRKLWCYPTVTYHHLTPATIKGLWEFEQEWMSGKNAEEPIRHRDVFWNFVLPQIAIGEKTSWNNTSPNLYHPDGDPVEDFDACQRVCAANSTCLQFAYGDGRCHTSNVVKVGAATHDHAKSGWMIPRIRKAFTEFDQCNEGDWILPNP